MSQAIYPLDSNHLGVRLSVLAAIIAGFFGGLFALPPLLRLLGLEGGLSVLLVIGGALGAAFGLSWVAETVLRRVWPSGRVLEVDDREIVLRDPRSEPFTLGWEGLQVWAWTFAVNSRRAWVPRGWYCLALRLFQDGRIITPYAFMKPSQAEQIPHWEDFEELISERFARRPDQRHLVALAAEQGHLRAAEDERWREGIEMRPDDFAALVVTVRAHVPEWGGGAG